jgi:hypothetical protein
MQSSFGPTGTAVIGAETRKTKMAHRGLEASPAGEFDQTIRSRINHKTQSSRHILNIIQLYSYERGIVGDLSEPWLMLKRLVDLVLGSAARAAVHWSDAEAALFLLRGRPPRWLKVPRDDAARAVVVAEAGRLAKRAGYPQVLAL